MKLKQTLFQPGWPGHIAVFASGAIYPLGFAPYHAWPLSLLSLVAYLFLVLHPPKQDQASSNQTGITQSKADMKLVLVRSFFYGFGLYLAGTFWLYISFHDKAGIPAVIALPLVVAINAGFSVLWMLPLAYIYKRLQLGKYLLFSFPALWVLIEWSKFWAFTVGFPWHLLGTAFTDSPLVGLAPITGVLGMSWAAAFSATVIFWLLRYPWFNSSTSNSDVSESISPETLARNNNRIKISLVVSAVLTLWLGSWMLSKVSWTQQKSEQALKISLIQPNIAQERKWLPEELSPTKNLFMDLSQREWQDPNWQPDIILWPEAAIPQVYEQAFPYFTRIQDLALDNNSGIISGVPMVEFPQDEPVYFNGLVGIGKETSKYYKQRLVPFGEYLPFHRQIAQVLPFEIPMTSFTEGDNQQAPFTVNGTVFAPLICYEVAYPSIVSPLAMSSDLLVTVSNDAWFGESAGPHQHFQTARLRAIETGRNMIRGTNTGITAFINHKGEVIKRFPQFEHGVLRGEVHTRSGATPFMKFGSWPVIDAALLILIICSWLGLRHSRKD